MRRLLLVERRRREIARKRREALLRIALDIERDLRRGFVVNAYDVAERVAQMRDEWLE